MHLGSTTPSRPSRARPRRLRRRVATVGVVVIMVLGGGVALAGCSGGGGSDASTTPTTVGPKTSVDIPLGDVSSDSAGGPVTVAADQSEHVLDALLTYVKGAMVEPLRSGKPATADFAAVFDPTTLASATTTDRGVLLDEGLPRVTGDLTVKAQPVAMVGLGDQGGALTLITAALAVDATGATKTRGAPLHVTRTANFTLQPDPAGTWKITAYQVAVTRDGADLSTTTTATAPTTGAAK